MAIKKILTDLEVDGKIGIGMVPSNYIDMDVTNVENDSTIGINLDINKENTSGAGFASNINGIKAYSKGNSSETIVNIAGVWGKAEHIGTGRTYYITGGTNRAYHSGTGDSSSISGTFSEAKVGGTGAGDHPYLIGVNSIAKLDNPNADVQFLQGQHCTIQLNAGEVTDNAMCLILDLDHTGGTISGDFEYLRIQNDTFNSSVGGTARAINSLSTLPSEFAGSIESTSFIKTGGASTEFLKADGSVDTNTYLTSADVTDSQWDDVTGGINYASGNVGIGTTAPSVKLHVDSASIETIAYFKSTDNRGRISIADNDTTNYVISEDSKMSLGSNASLDAGNLTIDSDGNVGIGTTSPTEVLHLENTANSFIQITSGNANYAGIKFGDNVSDTAGRIQYYHGDGSFQFDAESKFTFEGGNVGIGTTDPQAKLDVDGGIRMGDDTTTASADNEGTMRYYTDVNGSYMDICMQYQNSGTPANDYKWTNVVRHIFPS